MTADHGIDVWRHPHCGGQIPSRDSAEIDALVEFCLDPSINVDRILYDNVGTGIDDFGAGAWDSGAGTGRQSDALLRELICAAPSNDISVEARYTGRSSLGEPAAYNGRLPFLDSLNCRFQLWEVVKRSFGGGPLRGLSELSFQLKRWRAGRRFDGIRLDFEGPWPSGDSKPTSQADIDVYVQAKQDAGSVPVYASIGWHWDDLITFTSPAPFVTGGPLTVVGTAYQHILHIVDGVDVQVAWSSAGGGAATIADRARAIVDFASFIDKPAWITIETKEGSVKSSVQNWADGEENYGWVFVPTSNNGMTVLPPHDEVGLAQRPTLTVTFDDGAGRQTVTYSHGDGKGAPSDTIDKVLDGDDPDRDVPYDAAARRIDRQNPTRHWLLRFPNIIGAGPDQIPSGSRILCATLELEVEEDGNSPEVYQISEEWDQGATWNSRGALGNWTDPGANGNSSRKSARVGTLSGEPGPQTVYEPRSTFFDEGEAVMDATLAQTLIELGATQPTGWMYHHYLRAVGGGTAGWPVHP